MGSKSQPKKQQGQTPAPQGDQIGENAGEGRWGKQSGGSRQDERKEKR